MNDPPSCGVWALLGIAIRAVMTQSGFLFLWAECSSSEWKLLCKQTGGRQYLGGVEHFGSGQQRIAEGRLARVDMGDDAHLPLSGQTQRELL
jgi:hypothetical protein